MAKRKNCQTVKGAQIQRISVPGYTGDYYERKLAERIWF